MMQVVSIIYQNKTIISDHHDSIDNTHSTFSICRYVVDIGKVRVWLVRTWTKTLRCNKICLAYLIPILFLYFPSIYLWMCLYTFLYTQQATHSPKSKYTTIRHISVKPSTHMYQVYRVILFTDYNIIRPQNQHKTLCHFVKYSKYT